MLCFIFNVEHAMKEIIYKNRDAFVAFREKEVDILAHDANCFCTFGDPFGKKLKLKYPIALEKDKETSYGNKAKLGTLSYVEYENQYIVNFYTQFHWRKILNNETTIRVNDKKIVVLADYIAIRKCFTEFRKQFPNTLKVGINEIGKNAGGDWVAVEKIIQQELCAYDYEVYCYTKI